jgi:hypothetical protein
MVAYTAIEYQIGFDFDCYQLFAFLKSRFPIVIIAIGERVVDLELFGDSDLLQKLSVRRMVGTVHFYLDNPYHILRGLVSMRSCRLEPNLQNSGT